jgi:hypothetical protein
MNEQSHCSYSIVDGATSALSSLLFSVHCQLPDEILDYAKHVHFTSSSSTGAALRFPCPLKEQEATAAIKALEACAVGALADLRCGIRPRTLKIDVERIACFLMSAYLTTIDGLGKGDLRVKEKLPGQLRQYRSLISLDT